MKLKRWIYILIGAAISCVLFIEFFYKPKTKDEERNNDVILKIGKAELTRYELSKQKTILLNTNKKLHSLVSGASQDNQLFNDFFNYGYLLAGAYQTGIQFSPFVHDKVEATSKFMMANRNSVLYNFVIKSANAESSQDLIKDSIWNNHINHIISKSRLDIDTGLLSEMAARVKPDEKLTLSLRNPDSGFENMKLFSYYNKFKKINFTVGKLLNYLNKLAPIRRLMTHPGQFKDVITRVVSDDLLFTEAEKLGFATDSLFLLNQLNYRNRTIADLFKKEYLFKQIKITDQEELNEYNQNISAFQEPKALQVSVLTFKDIFSAVKYKDTLKFLDEKLPSDIKNILLSKNGIENRSLHIQITRLSRDYSPKIINMLYQLPENSMTRPLNIGNKIVRIKIEKTIGKCTRPFADVMNQIEKRLKELKEKKILDQYIIKAKRLYLSNTFYKTSDFPGYLNNSR